LTTIYHCHLQVRAAILVHMMPVLCSKAQVACRPGAAVGGGVVVDEEADLRQGEVRR